jgi:hypothetical protein
MPSPNKTRRSGNRSSGNRSRSASGSRSASPPKLTAAQEKAAKAARHAEKAALAAAGAVGATAAKLSGQQAVLAKLAKKAEEKAATAAAAAAKAKPETKEEKAARHESEARMKKFFRKMGPGGAGGAPIGMRDMSRAEQMTERAARGFEREINAMYGKK